MNKTLKPSARITSIWTTLTLCALAVAAVAFTCRVAAACDDEPQEVVVTSPRAVIGVDLPEADEETIQRWTGWMARLEHILPEGGSVQVDAWESDIHLCAGEAACWTLRDAYTGAGPEEVFYAVARALRVPTAGVRWLEGKDYAAWTVQVASTPWWEAAHRLSDQVAPTEAFMGFGGAGRGTVVTREGRDRWTYQVITGIYLKRADAERALEVLRAEGREGYVRRLDSAEERVECPL